MSDEALSEFFSFIGPHLDEKQRRLVAGAMAKALGRGDDGCGGDGHEPQHGDSRSQGG